jgi:hypothetical protein
MQLEDYFDFLSPDDIRIKGHRIGIDTVLELFLDGYTPEEIAALYPDLNPEKNLCHHHLLFPRSNPDRGLSPTAAAMARATLSRMGIQSLASHSTPKTAPCRSFA